MTWKYGILSILSYQKSCKLWTCDETYQHWNSLTTRQSQGALGLSINLSVQSALGCHGLRFAHVFYRMSIFYIFCLFSRWATQHYCADSTCCAAKKSPPCSDPSSPSPQQVKRAWYDSDHDVILYSSKKTSTDIFIIFTFGQNHIRGMIHLHQGHSIDLKVNHCIYTVNSKSQSVQSTSLTRPFE